MSDEEEETVLTEEDGDREEEDEKEEEEEEEEGEGDSEEEGDEEEGGDAEVSAVLGLAVFVAQDNFQIGTLKVRDSPPAPAVFDDANSAIEHGHAQCYDLKVGPQFADWVFSADPIFLDIKGRPLEHFDAATKYYDETGNDVYVWWEQLQAKPPKNGWRAWPELRNKKRGKSSTDISSTSVSSSSDTNSQADPETDKIQMIYDRLLREGKKGGWSKLWDLARVEYTLTAPVESRKRTRTH